MSPFLTFLLGMLVGWRLDWLLYVFLGRGRYATQMAAPPRHAEPRPRAAPASTREPKPATKASRDNLKAIKGIGPVIERKLNDAGIYSFEQLGNLTAADLRQVLGASIRRLADEDSILEQARDLARSK